MPEQNDPILGLAYGYDLGEDNWDTGVNTNFKRLGAVAQISVISATTTTPPVSPDEGDRYFVPVGATGAWSGKSKNLAFYVDGAWEFRAFAKGWDVKVEDESNKAYFFDGTNLVDTYTISSAGGTYSLVGTKAANNTPLKGITEGSNITIVDNGTHLTISSSAGSDFTSLTDTPNSYVGQAGLFTRVNGGETALEFFDITSILTDTFTGLLDTPADYAGSNYYFVRVNGTGDALEFVEPSTVAPVNFTDLLDTPADYTGFANYIPVVNIGESALTFTNVLEGFEINGITLTNAGAGTLVLTDDGSYKALAGTGIVVSVQSGTNVTVDDADVQNPIINLNSAITGVSVNGVTLTDAGAGNLFLSDDGTYVAAGVSNWTPTTVEAPEYFDTDFANGTFTPITDGVSINATNGSAQPVEVSMGAGSVTLSATETGFYIIPKTELAGGEIYVGIGNGSVTLGAATALIAVAIADQGDSTYNVIVADVVGSGGSSAVHNIPNTSVINGNFGISWTWDGTNLTVNAYENGLATDAPVATLTTTVAGSGTPINTIDQAQIYYYTGDSSDAIVEQTSNPSVAYNNITLLTGGTNINPASIPAQDGVYYVAGLGVTANSDIGSIYDGIAVTVESSTLISKTVANDGFDSTLPYSPSAAWNFDGDVNLNGTTTYGGRELASISSVFSEVDVDVDSTITLTAGQKYLDITSTVNNAVATIPDNGVTSNYEIHYFRSNTNSDGGYTFATDSGSNFYKDGVNYGSSTYTPARGELVKFLFDVDAFRIHIVSSISESSSWSRISSGVGETAAYGESWYGQDILAGTTLSIPTAASASALPITVAAGENVSTNFFVQALVGTLVDKDGVSLGTNINMLAGDAVILIPDGTSTTWTVVRTADPNSVQETIGDANVFVQADVSEQKVILQPLSGTPLDLTFNTTDALFELDGAPYDIRLMGDPRVELEPTTDQGIVSKSYADRLVAPTWAIQGSLATDTQGNDFARRLGSDMFFTYGIGLAESFSYDPATGDVVLLNNGTLAAYAACPMTYTGQTDYRVVCYNQVSKALRTFDVDSSTGAWSSVGSTLFLNDYSVGETAIVNLGNNRVAMINYNTNHFEILSFNGSTWSRGTTSGTVNFSNGDLDTLTVDDTGSGTTYFVYVSSNDQNIQVWSLANGTNTFTLQDSWDFSETLGTPRVGTVDGNSFFVINNSNDSIREYSWNGSVIAPVGVSTFLGTAGQDYIAVFSATQAVLGDDNTDQLTGYTLGVAGYFDDTSLESYQAAAGISLTAAVNEDLFLSASGTGKVFINNGLELSSDGTSYMTLSPSATLCLLEMNGTSTNRILNQDGDFEITNNASGHNLSITDNFGNILIDSVAGNVTIDANSTLNLTSNDIKMPNYGSMPTGTLGVPPSGMTVGTLWLDTTDSASHPIMRVATVAT